MQIHRDDISLVAKLRRECAFPLRLVRGGLPMVIVATAILLVILALMLTLRADGGSGPDLTTTIVTILLAGVFLVAYGATRGSRLACALLAGSMFAVALLDVYRLATDLLFGFPTFDFASFRGRMNVVRLQQAVDDGLLRDPWLLPLRLYTLAVEIVVALMAWRLARPHFLPSLRAALPFKGYIYAAPGDLGILFSLFKKSSKALLISLRPIGAVIAYVLYLFFLCTTVWAAYSLSTSMRQSRIAVLLAHPDFGPVPSLQQMLVGQAITIAAVFVFCIVMFGISRFFLTRAKRLAATTGEVLRRVDQRPPVLYLRSFRNDKLPAQAHTDQGITRFFDPYRESGKLEELVVARATAVGPVIAIGDPKTPIQSTGAARLWAGDAEWRDVVTTLMDDAALIIVLMDFTENLRWEVETLAQRRLLERTVFVFPPQAGGDAGGNAEKMIGILCDLNIIAGPASAAMLGKPEEIRLLMAHGGELRILASHSATYSDYDVALRIVLHELASPAAVRTPPLAHLQASSAAMHG